MANLLKACFTGDIDRVKILLQNGADINVQNISGRAALHCACLYGHIKIVELLLSYGADVNIKDNSNSTPLHYACMQEFEEIVELLLVPYKYETYSTNSTNADVNIKDNEGNSPLYIACMNYNKEIVELILASNTFVIIDFDINTIKDSSIRDLICDYVSISLVKGADKKT
jgi:ankyrin repeat protein